MTLLSSPLAVKTWIFNLAGVSSLPNISRTNKAYNNLITKDKNVLNTKYVTILKWLKECDQVCNKLKPMEGREIRDLSQIYADLAAVGYSYSPVSAQMAVNKAVRLAETIREDDIKLEAKLAIASSISKYFPDKGLELAEQVMKELDVGDFTNPGNDKRRLKKIEWLCKSFSAFQRGNSKRYLEVIDLALKIAGTDIEGCSGKLNGYFSILEAVSKIDANTCIAVAKDAMEVLTRYVEEFHKEGDPGMAYAVQGVYGNRYAKILASVDKKLAFEIVQPIIEAIKTSTVEIGDCPIAMYKQMRLAEVADSLTEIDKDKALEIANEALRLVNSMVFLDQDPVRKMDALLKLVPIFTVLNPEIAVILTLSCKNNVKKIAPFLIASDAIASRKLLEAREEQDLQLEEQFAKLAIYEGDKALSEVKTYHEVVRPHEIIGRIAEERARFNLSRRSADKDVALKTDTLEFTFDRVQKALDEFQEYLKLEDAAVWEQAIKLLIKDDIYLVQAKTLVKILQIFSETI